MDLVQIHFYLAYIVISIATLTAIWSLISHYQKIQFTYLNPAIITTHALIGIQILIGAIVFNQNDAKEVDQLHTFYGFITLVAVALLWSYSQQMEHKKYLLFGFGGMFVVGLLLRTTYI